MEKKYIQAECFMEGDRKIVYKNTQGLEEIRIPQDCQKIRIHYIGMDKDDHYNDYDAETLRQVRAWISNENAEDEKAEKGDTDKIKKLTKEERVDYEQIAKNVPVSEKESPKVSYADITDQEMFGFDEIKQGVLNSQENGLWAGQGLRKFKFVARELEYEDEKWTSKMSVCITRKDNDEIGAVKMSHVSQSIKMNSSGEYELFAYIDTNKLGKQLSNGKQRQQFGGELKITFACKPKEGNTVEYWFPIEFWLSNTDPDKCDIIPALNKKYVSIDFGTSSTCVAIERKDGTVELMTVAAREESDGNVYENPTYVMMFRWEEVYQEWKNSNKSFPLFSKGSVKEEQTEKDKNVQVDFGYSVKNTLSMIREKDLGSIVSEIKMIPKMLHDGKEIDILPYVSEGTVNGVKRKRVIHLVDDWEKQDEEHFDVVAFYGYILGRAINRVEKNQLYTRFRITYPVKFNKEIQEKMKKSLEYGLRRAIPEPLRTARNKKGKPYFDVSMKYPEPVAYAGAVCGKYLKVMEKGDGKIFAVYDFGGGTLDFAYGALWKNEDEETCISILDVDGNDKVGGETYIRRISYWLYEDNIEQLKAKKIPFELPEEEKLPNDFPEELFNNTSAARSNVKIMNEAISRNIFQNISEGVTQSSNENDDSDNGEGQSRKKGLRGGRAASTGTESMNQVMNSEQENRETSVLTGKGEKNDEEIKQGNSQSKTIEGNIPKSIEFIDDMGIKRQITINANYTMINGKLKQEIIKDVHQFKKSMEKSKVKNKNDLHDRNISDEKWKEVTIFKAGNSSKNVVLKQIMEEEFPEEDGYRIMLVDETDRGFMEQQEKKKPQNKILAITPKTAVAFGQQRLAGDIELELLYENALEKAPFSWNVFRKDIASDKMEIIIDRISDQKKWTKFGVARENMQIYFAQNTEIKNKTNIPRIELEDLDLDEDKKEFLWIRSKGENTIEYIVREKDSKPDETEQGKEVTLGE